MNEELRAVHMAQLKDGQAKLMYDYLCDACELREGGITDADQMLVADVALAEQIKQELMADIRERGIGREYSNGRQRYYHENKSVAQLRAYCDQQRKHMAELRLTPNGRKAAAVQLNDEFDRFPD